MNTDKLRNKINIIDLIVIALVVLFAAAMIYRVAAAKNDGVYKNKSTFEYVLKVDNVREYTVNALNKKGMTYDKKNNINIGEITNVSVSPCKKDMVKTNGTRVFAECPDKYSVYVTVMAEGTYKDGEFSDAADMEIGVGRDYEINTKYASTSGEIVSMKEVK